jgi:hypothetical protein
MGCRHVEAFIVVPPGRFERLEKPSDLGRKDVLAARAPSKGCAKSSLGQSESIVRRGVEIADSLLPSGVDCCVSLIVRYRLVKVPELRAAQRYLG